MSKFTRERDTMRREREREGGGEARRAIRLGGGGGLLILRLCAYLLAIVGKDLEYRY
jgi:hypothetical protein